MSANSSSSSVYPPQTLFFICFGATVSNLIFSAFTFISSLLLVPLSVTILILGHQRWRRQRSASPSPSDIIIYHMAANEIVCAFGSISYCVSTYFDLRRMIVVVSHVFIITQCGQMCFHVLTSVERYLAVVHPVTYRHLRQSSGATIRNASVWCVWLMGCAEMSFIALNTLDVISMVYIVQLVLTLVVVSFCSFSVLRVLKRPGPGDGDRARGDQSKRRAFSTLTAILGTLLLRLGGDLVCTILYSVPLMSRSLRCALIQSSFWLGLPSSLVLPLLFLHQAGKLPCCRSNTESGQGSA